VQVALWLPVHARGAHLFAIARSRAGLQVRRVPSASLRTWLGPRAAKLDEIEAAHRAVGVSLGRRWATEQLNQAYAVLLSSQFQGFCRDLHSECVDRFVRAASAVPMAQVIRAALVLARRLDRGNPNPANIGADFNRLGVDLWPEIQRADRRSAIRQLRIAQLAEWRNAIAHQDFHTRLWSQGESSFRRSARGAARATLWPAPSMESCGATLPGSPE
jgi:hypothetical protein